METRVDVIARVHAVPQLRREAWVSQSVVTRTGDAWLVVDRNPHQGHPVFVVAADGSKVHHCPVTSMALLLAALGDGSWRKCPFLSQIDPAPLPARRESRGARTGLLGLLLGSYTS
jgi:hypothetical protein